MPFKNLFKSSSTRRREREERMKQFVRETQRREREINKNLEELKKLAMEARRIEDDLQFNQIKVRYRQSMARLRLSQRMRLHVKMMLQDARMADGMKGFATAVRDFSLTMQDATKDVDMSRTMQEFDKGIHQVERTGEVMEDAMEHFDSRIQEMSPESLSDTAFDQFINDELEYQNKIREPGATSEMEIERELRGG